MEMVDQEIEIDRQDRAIHQHTLNYMHYQTCQLAPLVLKDIRIQNVYTIELTDTMHKKFSFWWKMQINNILDEWNVDTASSNIGYNQ